MRLQYLTQQREEQKRIEAEEARAKRDREEAKEAEEAAKNNALPGTEAIPNNQHGAEFIKLVRPMRGKFSLEEKHSATRYLKMKGGHNGSGGAEEGISVFARASPLDAFLALSKRSFQQSPAGKRARKSTKSKTPNGRQSPSAGPEGVCRVSSAIPMGFEEPPLPCPEGP